MLAKVVAVISFCVWTSGATAYHKNDGDTYMMIVGGFSGVYNDHIDGYKFSNKKIEWHFRGKDMPYGMQNAGICSVNSSLWIVGGRSKVEEDWGQRALQYSTDENEWYELPSLRVDREYGPIVFILNNVLYVAGGYKGVTEMESLSLSPSAEKMWQSELTKLPFDLWATDAVVVGDVVYVAGGTTSVQEWGFSEHLIAWNTEWDEWKYLEAMPDKKTTHCTVTDGKDKLHVIRGINELHQYSISNNSWTKLAEMPALMSHFSCTYNQDAIAVTGGMDSTGELVNVILIYDVIRNMWFPLWETHILFPLRSHSSALIQTERVIPSAPVMITMGGLKGIDSVNTNTEVYDIHGSDIEWSYQAEKMPESMVSAGSAQDQYNIYILDSKNALRYAVSSNTWHRLPDMLKYRTAKSPAFILNRNLYAPSGEYYDVTMESLSLDEPEKGWQMEPYGPSHDIFGSEAVVINDTAYIAGGESEMEKRELNTFYSWENGEWNQLDDMFLNKSGHCVVSDNEDRIFAIGGYSDGHVLNDVEEYSVRRGTWVKKQPMPYYRSGHSCFYYEGKIFLTGGLGYDGNGDHIYIYDIEQDSWLFSDTKLQGPLVSHSVFRIP